jgi:hypothetical protein
MIIAILFCVFWVLGLIFYPWPGSPLPGWPGSMHVLYMLLFALLGLTVFGYRF